MPREPDGARGAVAVSEGGRVPPTPAVVETSAGPIELADLGDGPPVLFVHGSPGGWDSGVLLSSFLVDAGFRVIAPSRTGYLGTPFAEDNATADGQARLHLALLDALGIDRFAVVGWSAGGPSSYRLAAIAPERVQALVALSAISGGFDLDMEVGQSHILERRFGKWIITEMERRADRDLVRAALASPERFDKGQHRVLVEAMWDDDASRRFVLECMAITASRYPELRRDLEQLVQLGDLDLASVRVPVLLVHGTIDADVPPFHSDRAEAALPDVARYDMPEGSHISFWTGPGQDDAQRYVIDFLQQHTDAAASAATRSEDG